MSEGPGAFAAAIDALVQRRVPALRARPDVLVGLIGRGIQLSRSPAMHEREASRLGLSCAYVLIDFDAFGLEDSDVRAVLSAAAQLGFNGVNVTYPFKQSVMPLLDEVSAEAAVIGAVNTIVFGDRMVGHNTDYWGFSQSFQAQMDGVRMENVTVFGAGGAGSAISAALVSLGARSVTLVDQDVARATELARRMASQGTTRFAVASDVRAAVEAADGLVNTTPVGMAKHPGSPFPAEWLKPNQWVADVVYFPRETELLRSARALGCRTMPGIGMAIGQAVRAFEHFTGRSADMAAMADHFEAAA